MPNKEPILKDNKDRFVIFPVKHNDIWDCFKQMQATFWTAEEIDLHHDRQDWTNRLNNQERAYLKQLLASMAASHVIQENPAAGFTNEVRYPGARSFFGFQQMMENTHWETWSLLLHTYIPEEGEIEQLLDKVASLETTAKKINWYSGLRSASFDERLVALAAIKGIFFAGAFCAINRLKNRNLMPGFTFSGNLISRDLDLHRDFAVFLHNDHLIEKPGKGRIREILLQAYTIENEFNTRCLPVNMTGMNPGATTQYLQFTTDNLLEAFGCEKEFDCENPFGFMNRNAVSQAGILEKRAGELKKAGKEENINKIHHNAGR